MSARGDSGAPGVVGPARRATAAGKRSSASRSTCSSSTRTKMFCGCDVELRRRARTRTSAPSAWGIPGSLPVTNEKAVEYATRIALALDCRIADRTIFHRKNYFYPDLPKAYQISQYDLPLGIGGHLDVEMEDGSILRVGITRVHMEEDAGKLVHAGGASGRIARSRLLAGRLQPGRHAAGRDRQRAGHPHARAGPQLPDPAQAACVEHLGVSDVNMEEGSLRCDANVSVRRPGAASRHQDRAQEHQLVPLRATRPRGRDRAADPSARER